MFGYVCGGRPVQTNVEQVEPRKFLFAVSDAARINHIAIFLLPGAALPPDVAAAVYCKLPGRDDFMLLGALTESKQSAIYKLKTSDLASESATEVDASMMDDDDDPARAPVEIMIGISIEPEQQTAANLVQLRQYQASQRTPKLLNAQPAASAAPESPSDIATLGNKIVAHAYNYMSSFVDPQGMVPIKAFDEWWNKFKSKIAANPAFLNSID